MKSMNNFDFLKPINKSLYDIILEAEKLYKDEYFEQSITQTRRFAENLCKIVLGDRRTNEKTFDDMLATLKDKSSGAEQEKEFIDDLYFLKKEGNNSVHSATIKQDAIIALECIQRAFELSINYAVYYRNGDKKLLKLQYDTELLITGKKSKKNLKEKYEEEKAKSQNKKTKSKKQEKQSYTLKVHDETKKRISFFKIGLILSTIVSIILILVIFLLSLV